MADWIKIETTTSQKIEVLTMADILDEDEDLVFGKLIKLWCWADANTVDGNAQGVTKRMIDRVTNYAGFADALLHERVAWLIEDEEGNLSFPNFDRHNGKGAKKRAVTARRVKQHRENVTPEDLTCNDDSVTESDHEALPEKRREEKRREDNKDLMSDNSDAISVLEHLNVVTNSKYKPSTRSHIQNINARLSEGHTVDECKSVIDNQARLWINDSKMSAYLRPSTLFQAGKFQGYLASARAAKAKASKHDLSNIKYESRKL